MYQQSSASFGVFTVACVTRNTMRYYAYKLCYSCLVMTRQWPFLMSKEHFPSKYRYGSNNWATLLVCITPTCKNEISFFSIYGCLHLGDMLEQAKSCHREKDHSCYVQKALGLLIIGDDLGTNVNSNMLEVGFQKSLDLFKITSRALFQIMGINNQKYFFIASSIGLFLFT